MTAASTAATLAHETATAMRLTSSLIATTASLVIGALLTAGTLLAAESSAVPPDDYPAFNAYCQKAFGAEKEPLAYEKFGKDLKILEDGSWQRVSETSACFAWETNLPAKTYVEYGETNAYGAKTAEPERHFYLHVHYLKGLKNGTTYHYRLVSVDERGKTFATPDATFQPQKIPDAMYIPGDMGDPPYRLTKPGVYVLTQDIVSKTTGINVAGKGITVDLGGHTITYDNAPKAQDAPDRGVNAEVKTGVQGIATFYGVQSFKLYNGSIVQGAGNDGTTPGAYAPLNVSSCVEIAGISVTYRGAQTSGFFVTGEDVHHNVVLDQGSEVTNRHQGVSAFQGWGVKKLHHNLVKRSRHRGIDGSNGSQIFRNEIYIDSCCTNSFAVFYYKTRGSQCHGNRLFGTGYHFLGVGTVSQGVGDIRISENFIHAQTQEPSARWKEYGAQSGVNGFRVTWGGENIEWDHNVVIVDGQASGPGEVRSVWHVPQPDQKNLVYHHNIFKAVAAPTKTAALGAITISGGKDQDDAVGIFRDNVVISNFCNVSLGGGMYGAGRNGRFERNTFVKIGNDGRYATIQCGAGNDPNCGHIFIDNEFKDGAGYDKVTWTGSGARDFSVGFTVEVNTAPGAKVTVKDKSGTEVFAGQADDAGVAIISLLQYRQTPEGRTDLTPHRIEVAKDGKTAQKEVVADKRQAVKIPLESP